MKRFPISAIACAVLLVHPQSGHAQEEAECSAALQALSITNAGPDDFCGDLAVFLSTTLPVLRSAASLIIQTDAIFSQREFQQANPSAASMAGSLAQSDATPSVTPTGLASGSIAMVGSEAGDDAIVALGINPAVLFFIDEASEALAKYSRFMDLSVFVPVTEADANADDGLDYFGVRLRMNWFGMAAGKELWSESAGLVRNWMTGAGQLIATIEAILSDAPDVTACATALARGVEGPAVTQACGQDVDLELHVEQAEAAARELGEELRRVRRRLDANYFGADVRMDWGDPTLGAVADASGTFLFAGVGYGRRLTSNSESSSVGLKLRAGARHSSLDSDSEGRLAFEGGLGLELNRELDQQEISAGIGVELRYGDDGSTVTEEQSQTNWTVLRSSLVVPITSANSLSIAVGVPLDGELSSYLSVNFNWALLLPGMPGS